MSLPSPEPAGTQGVVRLSDPPGPPVIAPPTTVPYHPPPAYPPPGAGQLAPTDGRAISSLAASILGVLLGLPFGVPGLALGPLGYFLGRSAVAGIDGAPGTARGRSIAVTGWVLGIVATAIGAIVSLIWLVVLLKLISTPTTLG